MVSVPGCLSVSISNYAWLAVSGQARDWPGVLDGQDSNALRQTTNSHCNILTVYSRFICQVKKQCIYININKIECGCLATQTPEWPSGLRHCISVQEMSLQSLVRFQAVSHPALIASPIGRHTIGPCLDGVGRHCK